MVYSLFVDCFFLSYVIKLKRLIVLYDTVSPKVYLGMSHIADRDCNQGLRGCVSLRTDFLALD